MEETEKNKERHAETDTWTVYRPNLNIDLTLRDLEGTVYVKFTNEMSNPDSKALSTMTSTDSSPFSIRSSAEEDAQLWGHIDITNPCALGERIKKPMHLQEKDMPAPDPELLILMTAVAVLEMNMRIHKPERYPETPKVDRLAGRYWGDPKDSKCLVEAD